MKLINGPYNNYEIEDCGVCLLRMGIKNKKNNVIGDAIYEISENRAFAFWLKNEWLGILQMEIGIEDIDNLDELI